MRAYLAPNKTHFLEVKENPYWALSPLQAAYLFTSFKKGFHLSGNKNKALPILSDNPIYICQPIGSALHTPVRELAEFPCSTYRREISSSIIAFPAKIITLLE